MYCKKCKNKIPDDSTTCCFCQAPVEPPKENAGTNIADLIISILIPIYGIVRRFKKGEKTKAKKICFASSMASTVIATIISSIPIFVSEHNLYVILYEMANNLFTALLSVVIPIVNNLFIK